MDVLKGVGGLAPRRHTFMAFLGTGKYEPTVYQRPGEPALSPTAYVQVALLHERLADRAVGGVESGKDGRFRSGKSGGR